MGQAVGEGVYWVLHVFLPDGVCFLFQRGFGDCVGVPCCPLQPLPLVFPPRFQLTVEMFDYMDCELKLSESGEQAGFSLSFLLLGLSLGPTHTGPVMLLIEHPWQPSASDAPDSLMCPCSLGSLSL